MPRFLNNPATGFIKRVNTDGAMFRRSGRKGNWYALFYHKTRRTFLL
jgi:hypothetical protein